MTTSRILFITWDGSQTQYLGRLFLPVLHQLVSDGFTVSVLQFSSADVGSREAVRSQCEEHGVSYFSLGVNKRLGKFGAIVSVLVGCAWLSHHMVRQSFDVIIPRSILPALVWLLSPFTGFRAMVYDSDGLPVEQRLEFEGMPENGALHKMLLFVEKLTLKRASAVISRSRFGTSILQGRSGKNSSGKLFLEHNNGVGPIRSRSALGKVDRQRAVGSRNFTLVYLGSWGEQYSPAEMISIVLAIRKAIPQTTFKVFSGDTAAVIGDLEKYGLLGVDWVSLRRVEFAEVHDALASCDVGLALRSESVTSKSVYPLKLADYLFAGIPVIGNQIGDIESEIVNSGVLLDTRSRSLEEIVEWCLDLEFSKKEDLRSKCRQLATKLYSLDKTADVYRRAIQHAGSEATKPG